METTNKLCEICWKLTIKTPERRPLWTYFTHCSVVSFVDFELVNPSWVSCKEKKVNFSFHFASSEKMLYLIGEKKVGEKWLKFLQVTKFFPDFLFPDQYFSSIFFHLTKHLSRFFFNYSYYYHHHFFLFICKIYYYHVFFM